MKLLSAVLCLIVMLALFTTAAATAFPIPPRNSCRGNCYHNVHPECVRRSCIQIDHYECARKCSKVLSDCYVACPETRKFPRA